MTRPVLRRRADTLAPDPAGLASRLKAALFDERKEQVMTEKVLTRSCQNHGRTAAALRGAGTASACFSLKENELTSRIETFSEAAGKCSIFSDFTLRIRRAFGGGRGQMTRAEYCAEIHTRSVARARLRCAQQQATYFRLLKAYLSDAEKQHMPNRERLKPAVHAGLTGPERASDTAHKPYATSRFCARAQGVISGRSAGCGTPADGYSYLNRDIEMQKQDPE